MGNVITLPSPPKRIISLVPSQTELLFDLGCDEEIVGRTKFCIHPSDKIDAVSKIGGTKNFKLEVIDELQPDLIIGNKEENYQEGIEALQTKYPVWMSDIEDLSDALDMIKQIGQVVDKASRAEAIAEQIQSDFDAIERLSPLKKALYFIWQDPYMVTGAGTFINEMLPLAGCENLVTQQRYPTLAAEDIINLNPDVILLSSEPFPFQEKHVAAFQALVPSATIRIVDGEMFSWYGSRLLKSAAYFKDLKRQISS